MTLTLRARLTVISMIVFGLLLAGVNIVSFQVMARSLDADVTQRLAQLTDGLHGYLRFQDDAVSISFDANDNDQRTFINEATQYYQIYDTATGHLLVESNGIMPLGLHLTPAEVEAFSSRPVPFDIATEYGRLRLSNSVRTLPDGRQYLLQVGVSLAPMDASLARYRTLLLWRLPLALGVALIAAWWLSGYALLPLSRMAATAREIDVNTLDRRLSVRGADDELDRLAGSFNETLDRLERSIGEMRQFSAALAHELRTPLAALRGEIELALRAADTNDVQRHAFASQIEDIDRLTRLIDHILTLARAEAGQIRLTFAPVNVGDLAATLVEQLEPVAEARSIDLRCERSDAVVVNGDAAWLQRLLLNLVGNALKYTNAGGRIDVRVSKQDTTARIDVQDTGIGLSPDDLGHVFESFFRVDQARSSAVEGAGLGLSLVQWIARQHHGAVTVQSRLGEGSTFTATFPIHHA